LKQLCHFFHEFLYIWLVFVVVSEWSVTILAYCCSQRC